MKKLLALSAVLVGLSGCYKINYTNGGSTMGAPQQEQWYHIGIFALVEFSEPVPLSDICPSGFGAVHHEVSFVNGLVPIALNFVGFGWVYAPHDVKVYCNSGAAYNLEVNGQGLALNARVNAEEWAAPEDFVPAWLPETTIAE